MVETTLIVVVLLERIGECWGCRIYTQAENVSKHAAFETYARKYIPVLRCNRGTIDHTLVSPLWLKLFLRRPFES